MHDDPDTPIPFRVIPLGRSILGAGPQRHGPVGGSRVVPEPGVFLPNYDRSEAGGSTFDRMPDYEGQSQEG